MKLSFAPIEDLRTLYVSNLKKTLIWSGKSRKLSPTYGLGSPRPSRRDKRSCQQTPGPFANGRSAEEERRLHIPRRALLRKASTTTYGSRLLSFFSYKFIKIHRTLRTSPAMTAGVTDRLWSVEDLVALWEVYESRRAERAVHESCNHDRHRSACCCGNAWTVLD